MDSIDLRSLEEELANLDPEDLRFLSKFIAEYSPTIQRKINTLLEEPIPEGVNKKLKAPLKPSKPIPIPPPRTRKRNRNRKQEILLDIFDPIRPNKVKTVTDYQNEILDLYEDTEYAGVEETSGRRFKRWRIVEGLNKDLTPRFMEKIRGDVGTSFYMRHVYSYLLVNIEDGTRLTFYQNKGSPWMKTYADAENWIREMEAARLDPDNTERPDTKWVFDSHFTVDIKVVLDRQPLMGTGPLPYWLHNLARGNHAMVTLDTYRDNLCLWRCIAVHRGARSDRSTEAARDLAKSFYKLRNMPSTWEKTSLDELEKVEMHLNKGKVLADWLGIRVYTPELANADEIEFGIETSPRIVWHLMRNPPMRIKNVMTIGIYGEHAFLIKDITKLAKSYECNHCHARFTKASNLQRHAERCSQGKTVIHCPGEKVEAPQTAYQKAFYPKHQASKESIQWLRYVEKNWQFKIVHAMSGHGGERWIEKRPVDGYNDEKKVVFQYHGCRWHGCPKCHPDRNQIIEHGGKTVEELYQATKRRTAHLRKVGYKVIECWSCQWLVPGGADKHGEELPKPRTKAYPHAILYDFEAYGATNQRKEPTKHLTIESKHIPVSVSIGDTLETTETIEIVETKDGKKETKVKKVPKVTHICARNPRVLVQKFMQELGRREKNIRKQVREEFMPADVKLIPKDQRKKIEEWCDQVPTLGFNSGSYDLNLIKNHFAKELADTANKVRVAKNGSKIMFLLTDRLRFLDIINYLGPGTSYERWVKAYDCKATKSWLPYEWFDGEEKLDYEGLPEYEHWYSKLKKEYVLTREEWEGCKQTFKEKGMKTFKDWLEYYNNLDVAPGLEALEKMKAFYIEKGIDILKDAVSIPGVSLHYLLKGAIERKAELYAPRKEAYDMLKGAVVGGPSLVFTRYHEAGKTRIRPHQYPDSRLCEKIQGYDANALYLSTMLNYMPCGKEKVVHYTAYSREHQTNNPDQANNLDGVDAWQIEQEAADFTQRLKQKSWFGYAEVDIEIPEHLHQKFEEMCPFFHKKAVPANVVPEHMKKYLKATGRKAVESNKKLLGTLSAEKILLYEPLLQWYINHGAIIKRVYRTIDYKPKKIFEWFVKEVTKARRTGDVDKSKALLADIFKLLGNSGYGKLIEALERQTNVIYTKDEKVVDRALRSAYFSDLDEIGQAYELESRKPRITIRRPFQIGIAVYQLAKLRMLQFYYDFLDRYLDRKDFELIQMDTDSNYLAISGKKLEDIVKPEMKAEFEEQKKNWLAWDKWSGRTPGLFKKEFEGERMIALCSKCYYAEHQTVKKLSSKGMSKRQNEINWNRFKAALEGSKDMATNRGFRMRDGNMVTYEQEKLGLSAYYDKRWVLPDGIHTEPIEYHE